ncbi:YcaO-like family protein [Mesorhizobium sp.]|uniref:YcaO-like family protein n=1 Tax=Mesorhizobium sp. TaxID=1871066 RepID=UPI0025E48745|nr:YcaO-like family protein [Mesorhizobium sp.]
MGALSGGGHVATVASGSHETSHALDPGSRDNRIAIARMAPKLRLLTRLPHPDAPGAAIYVAQAHPHDHGEEFRDFQPVGVAGCDWRPERAFEACIAEAAEYLSQLEYPEDRKPGAETAGRRIDAFDHYLADATETGGERVWLGGHQLGSSEPVALPGELCVRRASGRGVLPYRLGNGVAAGRTLIEAANRAIWELVERDAVARWWHDDLVAQAIGEDTLRDSGLPDLLSRYRAGKATRTCGLVDIRAAVDIPVIAAFSLSRDGSDFACGFAARPNMADAIHAATKEMVQMEIGHHLVRAKQQVHGFEKLNQDDLAYIARSQRIHPAHPKLRAAPARSKNSSVRANDELLLDYTHEALLRADCTAFVVNLTRDRIGIPVARALVTGLRQVPPSDVLQFDSMGRCINFNIPVL